MARRGVSVTSDQIDSKSIVARSLVEPTSAETKSPRAWIVCSPGSRFSSRCNHAIDCSDTPSVDKPASIAVLKYARNASGQYVSLR